MRPATNASPSTLPPPTPPSPLPDSPNHSRSDNRWLAGPYDQDSPTGRARPPIFIISRNHKRHPLCEIGNSDFGGLSVSIRVYWLLTIIPTSLSNRLKMNSERSVIVSLDWTGLIDGKGFQKGMVDLGVMELASSLSTDVSNETKLTEALELAHDLISIHIYAQSTSYTFNEQVLHYSGPYTGFNDGRGPRPNF